MLIIFFVILVCVLSEDSTPYILPGRGYSSVKGALAEITCFTPRRIYFGKLRSELIFDSALETRELKEKIGFNFNVNAQYNLFKAEGTLEYLNSLNESELAFSTHYVFRISREVFFDYPFQVNESLTEDGKAIYSYGAEIFRELCGDTYVKSYEEGGLLIYTYTFSFSEKTEKESFQAKVSASYASYGSATASYQDAFDQLAAQGEMKTTAMQLGGDPRKLDMIFPQKSVSCISTNLAACQETIDALYNYSQLFPEQIDLQQNETLGTCIGPYVINYHPFLPEQIELNISDSHFNALPDASIPYDFSGKAFSSVTGTAAEETCFTPRATYIVNPRSELHLTSWMKTQELREMTGFNLNAQAGYGKFKGEATVQYLNSLHESEVSFSTHYMFRISRDVFFDYPFRVSETLTEDGKAIYSHGGDLFRMLCGDTYVKSYEDGAFLIYSLSFSFATRTEKESFEANIGFGISFVSAGAAYQQLFDESKTQGTMEIRAVQVGGDPTKLSAIFPREVISCLSRNLEACQAIISVLYNYSQVFPDQVDLQANKTLGAPIGPYEINSYPFLPIQIDLSKP